MTDIKPEFDVFLCHNSEDKPQLRIIAECLKNKGIHPWFDEWELRPGVRWQQVLQEQISQIEAAAVFVGSNGLGPWQQNELEAFLEIFARNNKPLIPVLLPDAPQKPELPLFLRGRMWVDFRQSHPEPIGQLIWGITGQKPNREPKSDQIIQKLRYSEHKLNSASYIPSLSTTGKPAYFVDSKVFGLMPLDIGTIWGLQRSSFIGLLIGFEQTEIYENLKNVEFVLSQAIELNQKANECVILLPKREWIKIEINQYSRLPYQKSQIIDAVVDISNKIAISLMDDSFPNSSIPGFFFEIDANQLNPSYSEQIKNWCNALLNLLFPLQEIAIIINIISSIHEDIDQNIKILKIQLREIAEEIPIELMRLDTRLFFAKNIPSQKNAHTNLINTEENPGLPFCSWMHYVLTRSFQREKLDINKYKYPINLYNNLKEQYSEKELQDNYSEITARDIVLDIQVIAPTVLAKTYEQLLHLIVNVFPQWSYEWVGVYAESLIPDAVHTALNIITNAGLLSDLLMDAWVEAINIERFNMNLFFQNGAFSPDLDHTNNLKLEGLFLALLRREDTRDNKKIQTLLEKLAISSTSLQALHDLYQNQKEHENEFLNQNDPNQFILAIRAKVKLEQAINQFKAAPVTHLPTAICWLLTSIPPSEKNIAELLQLEPTKRAVFGLCTPQEWQQIEKRQEKKRQVLDCRRDRSLIYTQF